MTGVIFCDDIQVILEEDPVQVNIEIEIPGIYMAYNVPGLSGAPSSEDMNHLSSVTLSFWNEYFTSHFAQQSNGVEYQGVGLQATSSLFGGDIPSSSYNLYVEFYISLVYDGDSVPPPNAAETINLMQSANFIVYILNYVRTISAFISCSSVYFGAQTGPSPLSPPGASQANHENIFDGL